jgi:hypothetical protein
VQAFRFRLVLLWILAFTDVVVLAAFQPGPLSAKLDPGSILAIAGLNLVAVSVTFGVVGIQAQHFAETYTRAVVRSVNDRRRWPAVLVFQAAGVLVAISLALISPTLASGVAAAVLLGVGLVESGLILAELLDRFDGVRLLRLLARRNVDRVNRQDGTDPGRLIPDAQAVLDLLIGGAEKGDTEIIEAGLAVWLEMFRAYLLRRGQLFYDDEYIGWTFARLQELIETYGRRSAGVVLPKLIEGTVELGKAAAAHKQKFNEGVNEGVYAAIRCLKAAVATSVDAHLSPAAGSAIIGITRIGEALVDAGKVNTAAEPVRALRSLGRALGPKPELAYWTSTGLAQIIIKLAGLHPNDLMAGTHAENAAEGIADIVEADHADLGPTHFLTAPMSERSLPRLVYSASYAANKDANRRHSTHWDGVARLLGRMAFSVPRRADIDTTVRSNAAACCGGVLLALMVAPQRDPTIRLFNDLSKEYRDLLETGEPDRLHLAENLGEVLLAAYYASLQTPDAASPYRKFTIETAEQISAWDGPQRRRFAPALRRVGAAALHNGDEALGRQMARASLPERPEPLAAFVIDDEFETGPFGHALLLARPGLPDPPTGDAHLDVDARRHFLELEYQSHPAPDAADSSDE